ncbi:MAG: HNH endonuclease, partial [Thermogutta sp.]|nr:HNH endonuclease [Thermogutta sp.]
PLCEECLKQGIVKEADLVHHIIPVDKDPSLILVMDNLMSVCNHCHQVIHSRGGG